ncbi:hypothetical protein [Bradyrhizobium sp. CCBAU 051011]|uniref:hypothetical protein n=1 Tax=Bradyrhizobium sp. CCBAU 051011 TaxID=858422 RepID=UPI001FEDAE08|nr:hypothetical protein [Bradyrhizobium sp. CCBAU 051011]
MRLWVATAMLLAIATGAARADNENCRKSREYLLATPGGDQALTPQAYNDLFKICIATSAMPNVKDAYILKDGGIAVIPKQDSVSATASTLAQFCDAHPHGVLRFITRKEKLVIRSVTDVARISSTSSTPCKKIKGIS